MECRTDHDKDIARQLAEIIFRHYATGEITETIATAALEALKIRGSFSSVRFRLCFTGYDYRNQQWIVWNADFRNGRWQWVQ